VARRLTAPLVASDAVPLLLGLGVQALTTYLFLVIAGRELGPADFGALSGLYLLLTGTATGLFAPLEQEVTRRRGHERAVGTWDHTLHRRAMVQGLVASTLATVVLLVAFPATLRILGDEPSLLVSLLVALPGYACWFATRGELAGSRRLRRYAVQLGLDGLLRLVAALVFVAADAGTAAYGAAFALSPWLTLLLTWPRTHAPEGVTLRAGSRLGGRFALLVLSALAAQLLINAGPLVVNLLATDAERVAAGLYLAALVVIRVPVFLFTAVQPSFLRTLAEHVGRDDRAAYVRLLLVLLSVLTALTAAVAVAATVLGPPVVSWLFDFDERLTRSTYLLLTVAVGLFLIATVLAQGLLALGRHLAVTWGWLAGLVGLVAGTLWPGDAVDRATNGLLAGALAATVALALLVRRELSQWNRLGRAAALVTTRRP
jgi:O-antigen/teichoic acid export membrane protein